MTFTASEKRSIRSYLGYSGGFRDRGIRLESMMDVVGAQVEESAYARVILTALAAVDAAIASSGSGSGATYGALKKVDEVEFYSPEDSSGSTTSVLSGVTYGEVLIERLRALFGVDLAGRYFRSSSRSEGPFPLG